MIDNNSHVETFSGATKNNFKERYYGHGQGFRLNEKEYATTLSYPPIYGSLKKRGRIQHKMDYN